MKRGIVLAFLTVFLGMCVPGWSFGNGLMVIGTDPPSGSGNVSPELREIRIRFSAPVKRNSWSLVSESAGTFPELLGDPRFERDPSGGAEGVSVCVLPVRLLPGTTYALGVNSQGRRGFRSASEEADVCAPFVLVFRTAASVEAPSESIPPATVSPASPDLRPASGAGVLFLSGVGRGITPPSPPEVKKPDLPPVSGRWLYRDEGMDIELELLADGTYRHELRSASGTEQTRGQYTFEKGVLHIRPDGEAPFRLGCRIVGESLEIRDDEGHTYLFVRQTSPAGAHDAAPPAIPLSGDAPGVPGREDRRLFEPYTDRTEKAFSLLLPEGWSVAGGVARKSLVPQEGLSRLLEEELDFAVRSDAPGTAEMHWVSPTLYVDMRVAPVEGAFPPGAAYHGMTVFPYVAPGDFLLQTLFPELRPGATNLQVVEERALPALAASFRLFFEKHLLPCLPVPLDFRYEATLLTVTYDEEGVRYREKLATVLENRGPLSAGQWCDRFTLTVRFPEGEEARWAPLFGVVADSLRMSPAWVSGEVKRWIERGELLGERKAELREFERALAEVRRRAGESLVDDMFLSLSGQETYRNPFSGEAETGSNQWHFRWRNKAGSVVYTDKSDYDPNRDPSLSGGEYRRSTLLQ